MKDVRLPVVADVVARPGLAFDAHLAITAVVGKRLRARLARRDPRAQVGKRLLDVGLRIIALGAHLCDRAIGCGWLARVPRLEREAELEVTGAVDVERVGRPRDAGL